jgi:hypothetical protein
VQIFLQHFKSLIFSAGTLPGVALGIVLGFLLPQPYGIGWLGLLGWFLIPVGIISLPFGYNAITNMNGPGGYQWPQWAVWARWGVVLYYVLLLVCYGWCSYRATRQTGSMRNGLLAAVWVALVTIIIAIIAATVTSMWPPQSLTGQGSNLSILLIFLKGAIELCALFALPLLAMALLAGLVGSWLGRLLPQVGRTI